MRRGRRVRVSHRSKKVRKEARRIPVWGSPERGGGEDHDRYFVCWHCGFICDVQRDELAGDEDESLVEPIAYDLVDEDGNTAGYCFGAAGDTQTICEANGGEWKTQKYTHHSNGGCPLCSTRNWRGDYP